jgi:hypothetical protein
MSGPDHSTPEPEDARTARERLLARAKAARGLRGSQKRWAVFGLVKERLRYPDPPCTVTEIIATAYDDPAEYCRPERLEHITLEHFLAAHVAKSLGEIKWREAELQQPGAQKLLHEPSDAPTAKRIAALLADPDYRHFIPDQTHEPPGEPQEPSEPAATSDDTSVATQTAVQPSGKPQTTDPRELADWWTGEHPRWGQRKLWAEWNKISGNQHIPYRLFRSLSRGRPSD